MADVEALVQQGIAAIKAGRKDDAKRVLSQAIELDEHNEKAWLYMSGCVATPEEQQICLENVLSINPANEKARKGLDALNKAIKKPAAAPPPADPFGAAGSNDPFASGGFGSSSFDSNPFAGTGFESNPYGGSASSDPAVGSGWGTFDTGGFDTSFNSPVPDAPASTPTSVEWGATGAPAHGSGKNVAQPSADEYDSWVAGLSLPNTDNSGGSSFGGGFEAADPFGSGFGSTASDPFVADPFTKGAAGPSPFDAPSSKAPASQPDPFGSFGSSNADDDDPFGGPFSAAATSRASSSYDQDDPFAETVAPSKGKASSSYQSSYQDDDPFASSPSSASSSRSFADEEADPLADIFSDDMGSSVSSYGAASQPKKPKKSSEFSYIDTATMTGMQTYFDAIPAEIKGKKGGSKVSAGVLVSVLVLLVLNVVSIGFLVVNVMNH